VPRFEEGPATNCNMITGIGTTSAANARGQ
jgi:hypothetical protein